jgi:hypothetical protein
VIKGIIGEYTFFADKRALLTKLAARDLNFSACLFVKEKNRRRQKRDIVIEIEEIKAAATMGEIAVGLTFARERKLKLRGFRPVKL